MTHDRRITTRGTLASLAAAAGLLVSLRAIMSYDLPRPATLLGIEPMARGGFFDGGGERGVDSGAGGSGGLEAGGGGPTESHSDMTKPIHQGQLAGTLPFPRVFEPTIRRDTYVLPDIPQETLHDHPDS
jgi:hypothetical protein